MRATNWEFKNRAMIIGLIIGVSFSVYALDQHAVAEIIANWLSSRLHWSADQAARAVLATGALLLAIAALIRTWASSYLKANVVYASEVKSASLVADGPYRRTRNPLYFANVLLAVALGSAMSVPGASVCIVGMTVFCYRLIFREESELSASQGESYAAYCRAVPRLLPSLQPRVPASGSPARWGTGFKAEGWYWGLALALLGFAITLNLLVFFLVTAASIGLFWVSSSMMRKK
jgi:protein-S-isoprenylcysteine O-methyltransferase Ste14